MKKISLFIILFIIGILLKAQAPEKINYQAVARDLSGNPLVNQTLSVTFEIRQGSPSGSAVYTEAHTGITTNQFGLFTVEIGGGTPSFGTFPGIQWGNSLHYLAVVINGNLIGSSQLLSVPYALYAKESQNGPQGLPGRNSLSIVTAEPIGLNCLNGGNKIEVGTDDNGNSILEPLEIDFTYYVCNGDSGATGIGINWIGNNTTFPPTPNAANDAFYHTVHNTSYIYNGASWDTLVSGNVGSAGFWSQSGSAIYNNNFFGAGNVSIGTPLSFSKLTVASPDSSIASFIGNNSNVSAITISNTTPTGASGVTFLSGTNITSYLAYSPSIKTLSLVNDVTNGHIYINSDSTIVSQTKIIANQTEIIANQAQNAIYNNTDTIYSYSPNGAIINVNQGLFLTDSLYVLGNNFLNPNSILANNGLGQAKWTNPSSLGLGGSLWQSNTPNIYFNTGKVGIGTIIPAAKLHVGGGTRFGVADTGSVFFQSGGGGNGAARDWKIYVPMPVGNLAFRDMGFDNLNNGMSYDAMVIQYGTGNVGIGTSTPNQLLDVVGGENSAIDLTTGTLTLRSSVNSISGAQFGTVSAHTLNFFTANQNRVTILSSGNVGIGTAAPTNLLHLKSATNAEIMLESTTGSNLSFNLKNSNTDYKLELSGTNLTLYHGAVNIISTVSNNVGIGKLGPTAKLDVNGDVAFNQYSFTSPGTTYNAFNTNNMSYVRMDITNNTVLNGILAPAGTDGKILIMHFHITNGTLMINSESATATAQNRLRNLTQGNIALSTVGIDMILTYVYSASDQRWMLVSKN